MIDADALHSAAKSGLAKAWQDLWEAHGHETIYGFGFSTNSAQYVLPQSFTEDGLTEAVASSGLRRSELRWSPGDSPRMLVGEQRLAETSAIVEAAYNDELMESEADDAEDLWMETVYGVLVSVLRELASEGLFSGAPDPVLNIWGVEMGPDGERYYAGLVNPPDVAQRFAAELANGS